MMILGTVPPFSRVRWWGARSPRSPRCSTGLRSVWRCSSVRATARTRRRVSRKRRARATRRASVRRIAAVILPAPLPAHATSLAPATLTARATQIVRRPVGPATPQLTRTDRATVGARSRISTAAAPDARHPARAPPRPVSTATTRAARRSDACRPRQVGAATPPTTAMASATVGARSRISTAAAPDARHPARAQTPPASTAMTRKATTSRVDDSSGESGGARPSL